MFSSSSIVAGSSPVVEVAASSPYLPLWSMLFASLVVIGLAVAEKTGLIKR